MESSSTCIRSALAMVAMITAECTDVGMATLSKAAMTQGMSNLVFIVYYNALSTIILLPFVACRRKGPPFTVSILCRLFLLGLIGSSVQMLALVGLKYSSPTLSSAIGNLIPIFTFLLAITFRMEKINLRSLTGLSISLGAVVSVSGAFVITLYKGPSIFMASSSLTDYPNQIFHSQSSNWAFGGLLFAITCLLTAFWHILMVQWPRLRCSQKKITIIFFNGFFITMICGIFTSVVETNPNAWRLQPDIEMIAIVYTAIFGGVFRNGVHAWCLQEKGATYVTMFKPLGIVIAVIMGVLFLGETLYIGSVIGGFIVTLGFYTVMWGKMQEQRILVEGLESDPGRTPLLQNNPNEEI